ncbi:hypothetical protein ACHAWO_008526 [Cyclotella atomus]|jgi:Ni,Fe-hydrogenase maturation factor|uniref:Uncharacterized protein n=1 Tax=Cyclotella atomus TaxID=382360 RepID=A0ABD3N7Q1_9STRA
MSRAFSPPDTLSPTDVRTVADVRRTVWINGILGLGAGSTICSLGHVVLQKIQSKYLPVETEGVKVVDPKNMTMLQKMLKPLPPLGRNTFMLSLLGGGALGSFVMSTTAGENSILITAVCAISNDSNLLVLIDELLSTYNYCLGKNAVHLLHPIFKIGRDEHAGQSPYQIALNKSKQAATSESQQPVNREIEDELDAAHHRARSLQRRASMKERLESGHSLSSTHVNWPQQEVEDEETTKLRGLNRAEAWERRQMQRREWVHDRIEKGRALSDATGGRWDEK